MDIIKKIERENMRMDMPVFRKKKKSSGGG